MIEGKTERAFIYQTFWITKEDTMKIEAWIETHPIKFSVRELADTLDVSEQLCKKVVESNPLVRIIDEAMKEKAGPQKRYISLAQPLIPTDAGLLEEAEIVRKYSDELGRGAREEYYYSIEVASLSIPQKFRLRKG